MAHVLCQVYYPTFNKRKHTQTLIIFSFWFHNDLPFSLFRGTNKWSLQNAFLFPLPKQASGESVTELHNYHYLLWVKQQLSCVPPLCKFCRPTMKLIAPQAPHTALFSNLFKPEIEKHSSGKEQIVTGMQRGWLEVVFPFCQKNKPLQQWPWPSQCKDFL